MLLGGRRFSTPRHVFWNFVSSSRDRINQAKEDWKAMRFPLIPGDDEEFIPLPEVPDDGQLSVTEFRRVRAQDRRDAQRRAGRRSRQSARSSCSTAFRNRTGPGARSRRCSRTASVWSCPTSAGSPDRTSRRTSRPTRPTSLVDDVFALADALGLERFALVGHDWGGAIAWAAALRGDPRLTRLAIINAPHPVVFQKSLIEDAEQRAASQYINAFRTPGLRRDGRGDGLRLVLRQDLRRATSTCRKIPEAEKRAIYRRLVAARGVDRDAQLVPRGEGGRAAAGRDRAAARPGCCAPFPR